MTARRKFTPRPYQTLALEHLASLPRCALYAGMGLGKTVTTLSFLDCLHNVMGESRPTLVIAPLRVARSVWPNEVAKWEHLSGLQVVPITGDVKDREAALFSKGSAPIFTINHDNIPWLVKYMQYRPWPFATVIADESTRFKNFRTRQGGVRAQALAPHAHKDIKRWINLSGTPAPNGLKDLWGQMWFLDQGERLGRNYSAFEQRWFAYRRKQDAISKKVEIQTIILPNAHEEIHSKIADLCLSIDPKDWFDLKDPIVNVIEVDLPRSVRSKYREFERELFTVLQGHEIDAVNAAAKSMKCLQFASGAVYTEAGSEEFIEVHDEKIEALRSVVEEAAGAPILVAYHFKSDLARLQRHFPEARVLDADPRTEQEWNEGRIPLLLAHPASAGHGLNLQDGGNILVFFSHWWDMELHDQIIERIGPVRQFQSGHDRPVFIHYIVAKDTVDEVVLARHKGKAGVQALLMDYLKRRQ